MRTRIVILIAGFSSVIAQTTIMREALTLFGGYELVSGILLCFWLVWGGAGSLIFSHLKLTSKPQTIVSVLLGIQCLFIVYSIIFLRYAVRILSLPYGEVLSLGNMLLISLLALVPLCMVFGALFPALSKIIDPTRVYLLEGIGAFAGGMLVTFVLIHFMPPFGIILVVIVLLLLSAFTFVNKRILAALSCLILFLFVKISDIEVFFRKVQMPSQSVVAVKESRYGLIAITRTAEQINFYSGGVYDFSFPDPFSTEEAVHYPLLLHEAPQEVLLIGGGVGNCLKQILKHPSIKRVTYIELDPLLFKLGLIYIGENQYYSDKVQIVFGDARHYVKYTHTHYDVVIVNLPDPVNAQLNRFYTQEFFTETQQVLKSDGIFSIRISAPPNIVSPLYGELLKTVKNSLAQTYGNVLVLPASQMTYIASNHWIDKRTVASVLKERLQKRNLDVQYVNPYFFDFELTLEKIEYLQRRIDESPGTINTDLKPVCYYYTMILWGGVVSESVRSILVRLFHLSPWLFFIPLVLVFPFYRRKSIVYISIMSVGASEISAEILLIILFQVFYGYLYGWIGAIIACYMLGLAIGTILYLKTAICRGNPVKVLSGVEFIMGLYYVIIFAITALAVPGINILIPILIFGGGVIGGLHFPLSVAILTQDRAGIVYGVDLIGSALGALITAIILIPILGIQFTLVLFIAMNILVGIGLRTIRKHKKS